MDYIYDITLNFQDNYYDFYEWQKIDKIINPRKIPIYLVSDKDYLSLKYNEIILDTKNILRNNNMFLVTNQVEVMGVLIDSKGKVIGKSSLMFDEQDEILSDVDSIKPLTINYIKNKPCEYLSYPRIYIEKKKYIDTFIEHITLPKEEYLLKYIYYEIYEEDESDIEIIKNRLKELTKSNINIIYNTIKSLSKELKK